jgi:hypothetical protein
MANPYSFMHELGFGAKTVISMKDVGSIDMSFTATELLPEGCQVKLTGDMVVGKVAAATDSPIGIVALSEDKIDRKRVLVKTQFMAVARAKASGAVTAGNYLNAASLNADGELMNYVAHSSTNKRVAVALTSGADGEEILVGILRTAL